jgi:hypothetical protein
MTFALAHKSSHAVTMGIVHTCLNGGLDGAHVECFTRVRRIVTDDKEATFSASLARG